MSENSCPPDFASSLAAARATGTARATGSTKGASHKLRRPIMGNRAVITTKEHEIGDYLHWNGGKDTVAPLLRYCELQGYRPPSGDCYG